MKIRNGFVSNSSSSSFIVAFPFIPNNYKEVKEMLFGNKESVSVYDRNALTEEMAEIVFGEMKNGIVTGDEIIKEVRSGWYPNHPECYFDVQDEKIREEYWKKCDEMGAQLAKKFMYDNKDSYIFIFEYCDDEGSLSSVMEHGDIFSTLPHLIISKH